MKLVGIFAFFFGYTLLYAGVSRIQGKQNNTILGLLGFSSSGKAGSLIQDAINSALGSVPALVSGSGDGSGDLTSPGLTGGTIQDLPNAPNNSPAPAPIPNYTGNPISGPTITGTI